MLNRLSLVASRTGGLRPAFPSAALGAVAMACVALASYASAQTAHLSAATTQNFGSANIGMASSAATLTFTFDTAGVLGSTSVVTQGATGLDFADAGTGSCTAGHSYAAGATCTINAIFTPRLSGVRYGAAVLYNNSGTPIAAGYLQGIGKGPEVNFLPAAESTIPASGISGPNGIAVDAAGNIYFVDSNNGRVLKETLSGSSFTQSTIVSGLDYPTGVAVDGSGDVYVASWGLDHLLKEAPIAGGGYAQSSIGSGLAHPNGIAVDGSGNVYVADWNNDRVVEETLSAGSYTQSLVSSGVEFSGVAVDSDGNLYMTAYNVSYVLTLAAGTRTQGAIGSGFDWASDIAIDGVGDLYIVGTFNNAVFKETLSAGAFAQSTVATSPLNTPYGVAVDGSGNIYITDAVNDRVLEENLSMPPSLSFALTPVGSTSSDSPQTVTVVNNGNAALSFPVSGTGSNPGITTNFTLNSSGASACPLVGAGASSPGALAAGATCLLPISYSPTAATPLTGALTLTDNTLNAASPSWATQTIQLSGATGKLTAQPSITTSIGVLSQGQAITLTVTIIGVFGSPYPTGTVTISGTSSSASFPAQTLTLNSAGVATWTSSSLAIGAYSLTLSYSGDSNYNPATSTADGLFTVYGPPTSLKLFTNGTPILAGVASLYAQPETASGVLLLNQVITCGGANMDFPYGSTSIKGEDYDALEVFFIPRSAGTLTISCTINGTSVSSSLSFTVNPAPLSVTVTPALTALTYGKFTPPVFTSSVSGLVNGDTLGGTVIVSVSSTANAQSGAGVYSASVALSGSSASNYAVTVTGGSVRIEPAPLTVLAKNVSVTYGQTPAQPTGYFFYGFVNGDNSSVVSGAPILTTDVTSTTPRGNYPIGVEVGTLTAENYKISTIGPQGGTGTVRVYKAPLIVTANTVTMTEGGTVPPLTYTISGFVNGEDVSVVSGAAVLSTTVTSSTRGGEYFIAVDVGPLSAENYYFVPAVHGGVVKVAK